MTLWSLSKDWDISGLFSCEVFIVYWKRLQVTSPQAQKNGQKTDINLQGATFVILSYDTNCSMSGFENIISLHNFCVYTV